MKKNKVLVILGHPSRKSLCNAIVESYVNGAKKSSAEVRTLYLSELKFDPVLHEGFKKKQKLEKDLVDAQKLIKWAEHLVFVYPMWWYNMPALLKGFIDRTFLPGFAFNQKKGSIIPKQHLKGKSARLIITAGSPRWLYTIMGNPANKSIKLGTLIFTGVWPVRITLFGSIDMITQRRAKRILRKVERLGRKVI